MSESKHTPGPWKLHDTETVCLPMEDGRCLRVAFVDSGYSFIPEGTYRSGDAHKYQALADEIRASNARLISAAPELLQALKGLLTHGGIADRDPSDSDIYDDTVERIARAAIAKAEGQQ